MTSTLQPLDSFEVPRFSGLATFMRAPYVPDAEGIDIALVGVPFDFNLSRNGTRFGPSQVREMSRLIRRFPSGGGESPFDLCNVADVGDAPVNPLEIQASVDMIAAYFARLAEKRVAVVAMGGDHGVSYPVWKGLAQPGRPFGVVHFDAHPDTYHQLFGNRYNQGTMLRRGVEEGLIDPERLVSIGFRGTRFALDDRDFNHETGMRTIDMDEFERIGREATIEEARRVIGEGPTYVTFDVDGLDPAYCCGTGAPEPGGLSMRDAQVILRGLEGCNIVSGDVCEVSPPLDPTGQTSLNGANLMFEITCLVADTVARNKRTQSAGGENA